MDLIEFRQEFINEDVFAEAVNTNRYPEVVFIDHCIDILQNDYSLISEMNHSFFSFKEGTKAYKNMQIDASYLDYVDEDNYLRIVNSGTQLEARIDGNAVRYDYSASATYKVLEIEPSATDDEVRTAYRKMAIKHHPDKVASLGEDIRKAANEKLQRINDAKERIYKSRGMK